MISRSLVKGSDFNLLKLTFKALHTKRWPSYLNLERVFICRSLHSSGCKRLQLPLEKGAFQITAALLIMFLIMLRNVTILIYLVHAFLNSLRAGHRPAILNCILSFVHTIIADTFPFNRFLRYFFYSIFLCKYLIHILFFLAISNRRRATM